MRTTPAPLSLPRIALSPLRAALVYLAIGLVWILLSGRLVSMLPMGLETRGRIELVKGELFVVATTAVLYFLLSSYSAKTKAAQDVLLRTEEPYRLMVEETTEYAIFMIDPDGRISTWTAGAQRLYGHTPDQAIGQPLSTLFAPPGQEVVAARDMEEAARRGRHALEGWGVRRDGSIFWASAVTTGLRAAGGGLRGYVRLVRDMTERREAEQRLRESEIRYRRLVEEAPIGILVAQDGKITFANPQSARILGASSPEQLIGRSGLDLIHPDSQEVVKERIATLESGDAAVPAIPETWVKLSGEPVAVSVAAVTMALAGRRAIQVIVRDDTERRTAEAALVEANNSLEQRVHARTHDLERLNAELQSFTYSVSHDLRAPIRHIDGFARLLEDRESATLSDEGRRFLSTIRNSAQRMGSLIDDLLRLSRLGRETLRSIDVDMESMVRTTWDELTARGTKATLVLRSLPHANADPSLLRQVWQNLLDNAVKYSSTQESPQVTVDAARENGRVWYRIADNGVGFDAKYAAKLFAVFQRLHRPEEFQGTGVGLAIVKKVVELHGGQVRASGEPGKGAVFEFTLQSDTAQHDAGEEKGGA